MEAIPPPDRPVASATSEENITLETDTRLAPIIKTSWAKIVLDKPSLSKHTLKNLNSNGVVEVPENVLEDSPLWTDFLVGQFITSAPHVAKYI